MKTKKEIKIEKRMQDVLRYRISEMLDWKDVVNIALTNKSNYNALRNRTKERRYQENIDRMKTTFEFY